MHLTPPTLSRLIQLVKEGRLNRNTAVKVFEAVFDSDGDVDAYVKAHALEQVSDPGLLAAAVETAFAANPQSILDFKAGKKKALGFLVGQVMREMKGKADPRAVNEAVLEKLEKS